MKLAIALPLLLVGIIAFPAFTPVSAMYKGTSVVELDAASFRKEVLWSDSVWMIAFYAPWCGHCKKLQPEYAKAATLSDGVVKFGAIDADKHKAFAQEYGVKSFPTLKVFGENKQKKPVLYKDEPKTAKVMAEKVLEYLPSKYITQVTINKYQIFLNNELPKVLLFTEKMETAPMFKALSLEFKDEAFFGEVRNKQKQGKSVSKRFEIKTFPTILMVQGATGGKEFGTVKYTGKIDRAEISKWMKSALEQMKITAAKEAKLAKAKLDKIQGKKAPDPRTVQNEKRRFEASKILREAEKLKKAEEKNQKEQEKRRKLLEPDDPLITTVDDPADPQDSEDDIITEEESKRAKLDEKKGSKKDQVREIDSQDALETRCFLQQGLCVLAFFESIPSLDEMAPVRALARKARTGIKATLNFGWVDALKYPTFSATFGADGSPPTQIAIINVKRKKYEITTIDDVSSILDRAVIGDLAMTKIPALPALDT